MVQRYHKYLSLLLVFVLLVSSFTGLNSLQVQAQDEIISVSQAIANNQGMATVEGYIVGTTSNGPTYQHQPPFSINTNLALADSPSETNIANILPVQLPQGELRTALNLRDHPEHVGQKIRITGSLEAYFGVPGLKSSTSYEFVDGDEDPTNPAPVPPSIVEAKQMLDQTVMVEGVVTADNAAIGGASLSTFIQDETAGVNVFSFDREGYPDLKEGDLIRVTGDVVEYKGLIEITPQEDGLEVLSSNHALPTPEAITMEDLNHPVIAEPLEGSLVTVRAYISSVPDAPAGGGYNVPIIDENYNGTTLRVMQETGIHPQLEAQKWYDITAILGQYNTYQLIPRKLADVELVEDQPAPPTPDERYTSTVERVVDGDTIHLTDPILGATTVRFVNIDTAETYHAVNNELDASQKEHGEAAKEYLMNLLPAGTAVEVKVSAEPFDPYGRLLAEVIRQEDQLNTNLEMVRQGQAVTYFIWPIDEVAYEDYSIAVKQASDSGLGIWNPDNPLAELPFVFRAREQNKGLLRYVGNHLTKSYVEPEQWSEVPVEYRVFFASAEEAQQAGYHPRDEGEETSASSIQLLSVNDLHGKIDQTYDEDVTGDGTSNALGQMDYVASYIKEREATNPHTLLVHAGDMVGASSPVSALFQDEPTVEIMEEMGFDVGAIGNHELDEGVDEMLRLINGGEHPRGTENYDGINFPMLAANAEYKDTGELVLEPYVIKEMDGVKIGFIGVVTQETANMVIPEGIQNIQFTDETEAVNRSAAELQEQGVRAIVVLAHLEATQVEDVITGPVAEMAHEVDDEVDIIFAAHNHELVNGYVDNKLIVQAWEYGKAFADVDIEIDRDTQDIIRKQAEIVYVIQENMTPDAAVSEILANYENQVAPIINEVIGEAAVAMEGGYSTKGEMGDHALGNLIADGMRASMNTDFALMNGGGIRDSLDVGSITWGELYNIQPFNNMLMKLEVTGSELEQIMNAQISLEYGPDYSISGFTYTWNGYTGEVIEMYLPDGTPIDKNQTYTLVVNNFMATSQGSKYKPIGDLGKNPLVGQEDLEATVDFVRSFQEPITYTSEGRIQEIDDQAAPITAVTIEGTMLEDGKYLEEAIVTITATDHQAGVAKIEYSLDSGATWQVYNQPLNITSEGMTMLLVKATDRVGNIEETQEIMIPLISASLDQLTILVDTRISHRGIKKSTWAKINIAEKHFMKAAEERANGREAEAEHFERLGYEALLRVKAHVQQQPDQHVAPPAKAEIGLFIDYMVEHRTALNE